MKIYSAGISKVLIDNTLTVYEEEKNLLSYFYNKQQIEKDNFSDLFVDSGAFTAFTKKININLNDYCSFIKKNNNKIAIYANLDVIGDAKKTLVNQQKMEEQGLTPLPCFHANEPFKYLEFYAEKYDYFAIGGVAQLKNKDKLIVFLDKIFKIISKYGLKKIHGFGLTDFSLLLKYPFYSVDSTSWLGGGKFGMLYCVDKSFSYNLIKRIYFKEKEILDYFFTEKIYHDTEGYKTRNSLNIKKIKEMEKFVTNLWKERGIEWKD